MDDPIQLMPDINPGIMQSIEARTIHIRWASTDKGEKPDPSAKQVRYAGWDSDAGGAQYDLTGSFLVSLKNEAGIKMVPGQNYPIASETPHPHLVTWHWEGEWGNGTLLVGADYTLDLRDWIAEAGGGKTRGARYGEAYLKFREKMLVSEMSKARTPLPDKVSSYEKAVRLAEFAVALPPEALEKLERTADQLAYTEISQARIHIQSKAQTGAMLRAVRKLLSIKSGYSLADLRRGFMVYRLRDDFERMKEIIGPKNMEALGLAAAAKLYGLGAGDISGFIQAAEAVKSLKSGEPVEPPPPATPEPAYDTSEVTGETPEPELIDLPWRGELADPSELLNADKDAKLIARANARPAAQQSAWLKKHCNGATRYGQLTTAQGAALWNYLNEEEAKKAANGQAK